MDKIEEELIELASEAKRAITTLKALQKDFMAKTIDYDAMKEVAEPYIKTYNKYAKALAKARKMPYKPITLGYFMR